MANRLIHQSSPYLLQHADNPVDWYPWGNEAFEKAQKEDKPVFVSIGYSTCHWCHVMAHESFEDPQIASVLNAYFVSIKVDREERPDIDAVYMDVAQAMTGSGGWPLSIFMTPQGKPFFCGTYFPPEDLAGRPGFANLLLAIHDVWARRRDEITEVSDQAPLQLSQNVPHERGSLNESILHTAFHDLERSFDPEFGGFGRSTKFPQPSLLSFLLVYHCRTGHQKALQMVEQTLRAMSVGGICDHLGGGFHRYCVDRKWHVPHFEKMLYDQALISRVYLQAFQVTGDQQYADMAHAIFTYVLRDLTDPAGGFYSAEDADSEGREGRFYLWDYEDVLSILGPQDGYLFAACFGLRPEGNFESRNILYDRKSPAEAAQIAGISPEAAQRSLSESCRKLLDVRNSRARPGRDEKIITAWNGLMISALAFGSAVLNETVYLRAAQRAACMILQNSNVDGRLKRFFKDDKTQQPAFLEDYAFFSEGLLDLYQADFNPQWLSEALILADRMIDLFEDAQDGAFFFTGSDAEQLILRQKPQYDAAIPSGNSVAAKMLMQAASLSGRTHYFNHAQKTVRLFAADMEQHGSSMAEMLIAADYYFGPRQEIVIAGRRRLPETMQFMRDFYSIFLPRSVIMLRTGEPAEALLDEIYPAMSARQMIDGRPAAYLCEDFSCKAPLTDRQAFRDSLAELK